MNKNILSVSPYYLKACVENGVCPLNWLAEYYQDFPGKLVMVDKTLLSFLLNKSCADKITEQKHDGFVQKFTIIWEATEEFPEIKVVISSYGRTPVTKEDGEYIVDEESNYYVIEELEAEEIIVKGTKYAENAKKDGQILFLVTQQLEKTLEKTPDEGLERTL